MEEFFFRAVERVGFPVVTAALSFWLVYKLFNLRERDRVGQLALLVDEAKKQTSSLSSIDVKVQKNNDVTQQMLNKLGSDPGVLCQFKSEQAALHFEQAAESIATKLKGKVIVVDKLVAE